MAKEISGSIHAFIAGTHKTRLGQEVTIDAVDLSASAKAYNPELHEAPLVIGHPEGKAPAYGWIESCDVNGDNFFVTPKQVNPDFAELHNSGAFKKRSMSFYHPDNELNPVPGVWYPRHLGFLGAQAPAIKGLNGFEFGEGEGDGDILTVEFGEVEDRIEAGMWRNLREWILAKFGKDDADSAVAGYDVDFLQAEAVRPKEQDKGEISPAQSPTNAGFSEHQAQTKSTNKEGDMTPEEIAAKQAELDAQQATLDAQAAEFSERETALTEREEATHRTGCADFVESLVDGGKVMPAQKDNLIEFMAGLEHVETVEFSEGDETVKKSPLQYMKDYLNAQPKFVDFGEHPAGDDANASFGVTVNVPAGYEVNTEKAGIHAKAVAFAESNKVDYITAVKAVSKGE
jgi:hypothetical protein